MTKTTVGESWEVFPNAPIVEALIEIRVDRPPGTSADSLLALHERIRSDFPIRRDRWASTIELSPQRTSTDQRRDGFLFSSADGKKVVQARQDGFAYSRLRPYQRWDVLRKEARELWPSYCAAACPTKITQCAVRYINRIVLPMGISPLNLDSLFHMIPRISEPLPQLLEGFFFRIILPHRETLAKATVTQATARAEDAESGLVVVLDIDAFQPVSTSPNEEAFWETLDQLREFKNAVFFAATSEKLKGLFRGTPDWWKE